ncbi:MAG: LicD family protein [Synergistaceae bacterium]|nr:LicD family protein [Synergistaceae bacterium]
MRQLDLAELRKIQLGILDVVAKFCDEYGISYFLNAGTLLGAIRHKGYIPWDDDIDLGMLRPDYDRFMKLFNGYKPHYIFVCGESDPNFFMPFGHVEDTRTIQFGGVIHGVNVDIFCLDNAPDDPKELTRMFRRYFFYRTLLSAKALPAFQPVLGSFSRRLLGQILRILIHLIPIPKEYFMKKVIENFRMYQHEDTKRVGDFQGSHLAVIERELVAKTTYAEFEGKKYKIPVGYDEWLTTLYGDYMKLPPKSAQKTHHSFKAYIKEEEGE